MHFKDDIWKLQWSVLLDWSYFATTYNGEALKTHYYHSLFYEES